jgi:hypothetical protein
LGIASDQASRGRLRRYQWSWKEWRWKDLPLRRYLPRECLCKPYADTFLVPQNERKKIAHHVKQEGYHVLKVLPDE